MLIPNMILKNCHMYIFVVFCLHVTKSKQISNIFKLTSRAPSANTMCSQPRSASKRSALVLIEILTNYAKFVLPYLFSFLHKYLYIYMKDNYDKTL